MRRDDDSVPVNTVTAFMVSGSGRWDLGGVVVTSATSDVGETVCAGKRSASSAALVPNWQLFASAAHPQLRVNES
jgi:hypothetical protein